MVPKLVLFANLFGLFLVDAFLSADVRINQTLPSDMSPGSEVRVNVTVEKGELTGFAKFQLDLPVGLSATAIETKGASFTFADNKAKFIWMSLPAGPSFTFSYTLKADASARGTLPITGRLSYIEDNERKTHDLPTHTVNVGAGDPSGITARSSSAADTSDDTNDLVSASAGATPPLSGKVPMVVVDAAGIPPAQGPGGVSAARTITPVSDKEMLVEVLISKGSIRGFGKLQETIPAGFTALEKSSDEAIFTAQERVVKFVWLNLPARDDVRVVYKLRATGQPDGEYTVDGEFGYLLNDETQKAVVGSSRFYIGPKAMELLGSDAAGLSTMDSSDGELNLALKEAPVERTPASEPVTEAPKSAPPSAGRSTRAGSTSRPAASPSTTVTSTPTPERGVVFKVQIAAGHREVDRSYFAEKHRYSGDLQMERHEGWIKYVTGRHATYREARDQRVNFVNGGHGFPGPFVTAYNNGERITVQEALMITQQQWVQ
jgi:hypothetical protein